MTQEDPPEIPGVGWTPTMKKGYLKELTAFLKRNRLVDSDTVTWLDAPGGGKMPLIANLGTPKTFLANVDGELKNVDFLITGTSDPDPEP